MVNLSQDDPTVIAKHPLDNSLDHLQDELQKAEEFYKSGSTSCNGAVDTFDHESFKAILKLLNILRGHEAAFNLRSKNGMEI